MQMMGQGPMPPVPLPPGLDGPVDPGLAPVSAGVDPSMLPPAPADPGVQGLAMAIANAIQSYQENQAAEAVNHPVVQSMMTPPDASRAMGGGALPPMPPAPAPGVYA